MYKFESKKNKNQDKLIQKKKKKKEKECNFFFFQFCWTDNEKYEAETNKKLFSLKYEEKSKK